MYAAFSHGKTPVSMDTALLKWMKTFVTDKHVRVRTKGCGFLSKTVFVVSLSSALLQGTILYSTPKLHWFCYTEARMQSQSVKASCLCMLQSVFSVSLPMRHFCFQQCVCVYNMTVLASLRSLMCWFIASTTGGLWAAISHMQCVNVLHIYLSAGIPGASDLFVFSLSW